MNWAVYRYRLCHERADFRDVGRPRRSPAGVGDREQPYLVERFDDRAASTLCVVGGRTSRECLQMPEGRRALELTQGLRRQDEAPDGAPGTFAGRNARAFRVYLSVRCEWEREQQDRDQPKLFNTRSVRVRRFGEN